MNTRPRQSVTIEQEELRGISRTVAEIEWLLVVLVLLYQVFEGPAPDDRAAIGMGLFFFGAMVVSFRYANFYLRPSRWKIVFETLMMILFITWSLWFTGKLASPLLNIYILVIITSSLALGKFTTMFVMALIASCFVLLGGHSPANGLTLAYVGTLALQLSPMLLVAYVTTMFSADIRYGLNQAKLLSETDELTGMLNMRGFAIVASRLISQAVRFNRPASLLMIDSDNLKSVNDTLGHEAGDRLLQQMATCIQSALRDADVAARYGGDEFVVMLPQTPATGALHVAKRICHAIATSPLTFNGKTIKSTVSIGVATYPEDGPSLDALKLSADSAMYSAKGRGRNQVVKHVISEPEAAVANIA